MEREINITNAEWLRGLSNEELAMFIARQNCPCFDLYFECPKDPNGEPDCHHKFACHLAWLLSPHRDDPDFYNYKPFGPS